MKIKTLNIEQLAKFILPAFAMANEATIQSSNERSIFYSQDNNCFAWVPTDIKSLVSSYFGLYESNKEEIEDINLIINTDEYFGNPEGWIYKFTKTLSEEFDRLSQFIEMDFEYEYLGIKYEKEDLLTLEELDYKTLNQLLDMCRWIIAEKNRRRILEEFKPSKVKLKEYKSLLNK